MTSFMNDHLNLGLETSSESSYLVSETIPFLVQAHSGFKLKDNKIKLWSQYQRPNYRAHLIIELLATGSQVKAENQSIWILFNG